MRRSIRTLLSAAISCAALAGSVRAQPVQVLPTLGGTESRAQDINDRGQVAGSSRRAGDGIVEATIWNGGIPHGLGMAPGTAFSYASAINNEGVAVGHSETGPAPGAPENTWTATYWDESGPLDIGASLGLAFSTAHDINDNGIVAVEGDHPDGLGGTAGYAWSLSMGAMQAGADPLYRYGANFGINSANDLVGYGQAGFDGAQAIYAAFQGTGWAPGIEIGPQSVRDPAFANAISADGVIVGIAGDGGVHRFEAAIFTLDPKRPVIWLDKLDDFEDSEALDVNSHGLIVGSSVQYPESGPDERAVVWVDGEIHDLNHLLRGGSSFAQLLSATGVNENGDIVGYGRLRDGGIRGFVIVGFPRAKGGYGRPGEPARLP